MRAVVDMDGAKMDGAKVRPANTRLTRCADA